MLQGTIALEFWKGGTCVDIRTHHHAIPLADVPIGTTRKKAVRGTVNGFSSASRRRMMRFIGTLNRDVLAPGLFVSLTYPKMPEGPEECKRHLKNFVDRLKRRSPDAWGIWRYEEGEQNGRPHFHLLLWDCHDRFPSGHTRQNWLDRKWLEWAWQDTIKQVDHPRDENVWDPTIEKFIPEWEWWDHRSECYEKWPSYGRATRVERMQSWNGTTTYISKYCAKDGEYKTPPGRVWGIINPKAAKREKDVLILDSSRLQVITRWFAWLISLNLPAKGKRTVRLSTRALGVLYRKCLEWSAEFPPRRDRPYPDALAQCRFLELAFNYKGGALDKLVLERDRERYREIMGLV